MGAQVQVFNARVMLAGDVKVEERPDGLYNVVFTRHIFPKWIDLMALRDILNQMHDEELADFRAEPLSEADGEDA